MKDNSSEEILRKSIRIVVIERILTLTLPILIVFNLVIFVSHFFRSTLYFSRIAVVISILIGLSLSLILLRKRQILLASLIYVVILGLTLIGGMVFNGGVSAPAYIGLLIWIISVGVFYGTRAGWLAFVFVIICSGSVVILQYQGIVIPSEPRPPLTLWITFSSIFGMGLIITEASSKLLEEKIGDIQSQNRVIQEKESLTNAVLDSVLEAVIAIDRDGRILRINQTGKELLQLSVENERSKHVEDLFSLSDERGRPYIFPRPYVKEMPQRNMDLWIGSTPIPVSISARSLSGQNGKGQGIVLTIKDITKDREFQKQLIQSQKMEAMGQLASGVAHDFNNMLGGILMASEQLAPSLGAEDLKMVMTIQQAAERASRLARQLLDYSRKGKIASTAVDIHHLLQECKGLLSHSLNPNIQVVLKMEAHNPLVVGDDNQIQNGLINLAINGAQSMEKGGELCFATTNVFFSEDFCKKTTLGVIPGEHIRIDVIDHGSGMSQEVKDRAFEPFFTTKESGTGTGLGLPAVKGMVESHNGTISLYSELGQGTSFHIYLPSAGSNGNNCEEVEEEIPMGQGEHILLIDDEELILNTAKIMLECLNYRVSVFSSGQEALENIADLKPDLIILDMIMPGMNGRETFEALMEKNTDLKTILASGFSKQDDIRSMEKKGLRGFIRKPYRRAELAQLIHKTLLNKDI